MRVSEVGELVGLVSCRGTHEQGVRASGVWGTAHFSPGLQMVTHAITSVIK